MYFSSAENTITSSGILRMMSPKSREFSTMRPCSRMSASRRVRMPVCILYPDRVSTSVPSSSRPSRPGIELLVATVRDAVFTASCSNAFSQENFSMAQIPF